MHGYAPRKIRAGAPLGIKQGALEALGLNGEIVQGEAKGLQTALHRLIPVGQPHLPDAF
jgi:hypothetical protein